MRKSLLTLTLLLSINFGFSQYKTKLKKWNLTFENTEKLDKYSTGIKNLYGWDSDNYAVDIGIKILDIEENKVDLKKNAFEFSTKIGLMKKEEIGKIFGINLSYCIKGETMGYRMVLNPTYIVLLYNPELSALYEITVIGYNGNITELKKIANSFKFTEK